MYPAGAPVPANGTPGISGVFVWNFVDPDNLMTITPPDDAIALPGWTVRFETSAAVYEKPLLFQWERDGVPLAGATNAVLVLDEVTLAMDGTQYRCRISAPAVDIRTATARLIVRPMPQMLMRRQGTGVFELFWPSDGTPQLFQTATNLAPPVAWETWQRLDQTGFVYRWNFDPQAWWLPPRLFIRVIPETAP